MRGLRAFFATVLREGQHRLLHERMRIRQIANRSSVKTIWSLAESSLLELELLEVLQDISLHKHRHSRACGS